MSDDPSMPTSPLYANTGATPLMTAPGPSYDGLEEPEAPGTEKAKGKSIWNIEITPKKIKRADLMHFSRQLSVFIKAGIPLIEALETINSENTDKFFHEIVDNMIANLRAGSTFAASASGYERAFPPYYLGILRSAELSGNLDSALGQLAEYIERDLEARRKIISAVTYPAIVAIMAVGVVIILVAFVLPRFRTFFADLNAKLPLPTRMLLAFTEFTQEYWWLFVLLGIALVGLALWMTQAQKGRETRDKIFLRMPALGELIQTAVLERFCRILSSMTSSGVPLPEALSVVAESTSNTVYRAGISEARLAMMRGEGLAAPLAATGLFPASARQMLRVGEDTGSLDEQLETAAAYFDRELEYKIKKFTSLFEPLVIVFVGIVVGFVAVALVSAMYGIFHQVHP